jgi:molybdopterin converting factor subunit 1
MRIRLRHFASLRDLVGAAEGWLELPEPATAEDAFRSLAAAHPGLATRRAGLSVAINRRYAGFDAALADGDELVFIPPVSGG